MYRVYRHRRYAGKQRHRLTAFFLTNRFHIASSPDRDSFYHAVHHRDDSATISSLDPLLTQLAIRTDGPAQAGHAIDGG
jgi:hypothetical protein